MRQTGAFVDTVARSDADLIPPTHLRAELARLEQQLTLQVVVIAAIANGILFAVLRQPRPAVEARRRHPQRFRQVKRPSQRNRGAPLKPILTDVAGNSTQVTQTRGRRDVPLLKPRSTKAGI